MVDRYFQKALSDINAPKKVINSIVKVTDDSLSSILLKIKENLLGHEKKHSRKSSSRYDDINEVDNSEGNYKEIFDSKLFIAKMTRERFERERKKIERDERARQKLQASLEEQENKKKLELDLKELEKKKRVEELLKKKENRKKQLEEIKEIGEREFREVVNTKPLYIKIEENYEEQVLMPELEKKKAELARKREFLQPIKRQEILEHMKKYQESAIESQVRRELQVKNKQLEFKYNSSAAVMKSRFTERVLEEEKKRKEDREKVELEKTQLIEKKKKYANIVKEMFVPSVDEFKKQEMLLIQERLKHPVRLKLSDNSISDEEKPKRKWKKNPMVPPPKIKKEPKVVDYLSEMRQKRGNSVQVYSDPLDVTAFEDNSDMSDGERIEKIKKHAEYLEKQANVFDKYLNQLK